MALCFRISAITPFYGLPILLSPFDDAGAFAKVNMPRCCAYPIQKSSNGPGPVKLSEAMINEAKMSGAIKNAFFLFSRPS